MLAAAPEKKLAHEPLARRRKGIVREPARLLDLALIHSERALVELHLEAVIGRARVLLLVQRRERPRGGGVDAELLGELAPDRRGRVLAALDPTTGKPPQR